ncbi:uncharacterized protein [Spinacia oleracea]|uniref:Reverse transcriptase zinc-binding domain-containing protein n=1 Tax=Spinacia oleracea TaxID=3562 RepID=A0ABM3RJM1_SPIOL|nr:uncharacterized protein LOC130470180 [Spinacia oleracea]
MASPKSIFVTWLAILHRLTTKDRMLSWGMQIDGVCCLCDASSETLDHIFFQCAYSSVIWHKILGLLKIGRSSLTFDQEVMQEAATCRHPTQQLLGMCFSQSVYTIWLQRNKKNFTGDCERPEVVYRNIIFKVACRCNDVVKAKLII